MWSFERVWEFLHSRIGTTYLTLDQGHPFVLLSVSANAIVIRIGRTNRERSIRRSELEDSWNHLTSRRRLSRVEVRRLHSPYNPAYVVALLASVPGAAREGVRTVSNRQ